MLCNFGPSVVLKKTLVEISLFYNTGIRCLKKILFAEAYDR